MLPSIYKPPSKDVYHNLMKHLKDLFPDCAENPEIRDVRINSRDVRPGDLFICTKGATADRHDYVSDAVENGAAAVIASRPIDSSVPVVYVHNTNEALPHIAAVLYGHPEKEMNLTAVTGTNGKTTVATILSDMMGQDWFGNIGTNGISCAAFQEPIRNTCPDADRMYQYLRRLSNAGCNSAVLEATSEALLFGRLDSFRFDTVIFTNITHDHLNTHKTIENYVKAKLLLLSLLKENAIVILNADDSCYEREKNVAGPHRVISYGMASEADLRIETVKSERSGLIMTITIRGKLAPSAPLKQNRMHQNDSVRAEEERVYTIKCPLKGDFNAWNLCAALCAMLSRGMTMDDIIPRISRIRPVAGRMEELFFGQPYRIVLDYAHTVDAFRQILPYLVRTGEGRLITLTGSAGEREKEKRPEIGRLVTEYSDTVIFTMDDPRTEDVNEIIEDLISGCKKDNYIRIPDRAEAISAAIRLARPGDTVLIAGKGRDPFMALGEIYIPYSDYDVIASVLNGGHKNTFPSSAGTAR